MPGFKDGDSVRGAAVLKAKQTVSNGGVSQNCDINSLQSKIPANCLLSVSPSNPAGKFKISCPGKDAASGTMVDYFIPVSFDDSTGAPDILAWVKVNTPDMQIIKRSDFNIPDVSSTVKCGWKNLKYVNGVLNLRNGNDIPQSVTVPVDPAGKPTCKFAATGAENDCVLSCS
jgi:hypothetical protein